MDTGTCMYVCMYVQCRIGNSVTWERNVGLNEVLEIIDLPNIYTDKLYVQRVLN